jgi:hypothetical protein
MTCSVDLPDALEGATVERLLVEQLPRAAKPRSDSSGSPSCGRSGSVIGASESTKVFAGRVASSNSLRRVVV